MDHLKEVAEAQILVVAALVLGFYHRAMELVGKDLIEFEQARGSQGKSIRKKLENHFAQESSPGKDAEIQSFDAHEKAKSVWRSWLRWRKAKSHPRRESQLLQAIGLGFSSIEECKEAFDAFKLNQLRVQPTQPIVGEVGEAVSITRQAFVASPGKIRAAIEKMYAGERIDQLRDDARNYVETKLTRLHQLAGQMDELILDVEGFLELKILKPPSDI